MLDKASAAAFLILLPVGVKPISTESRWAELQGHVLLISQLLCREQQTPTELFNVPRG